MQEDEVEVQEYALQRPSANVDLDIDAYIAGGAIASVLSVLLLLLFVFIACK